jgi:hypothetical protein
MKKPNIFYLYVIFLFSLGACSNQQRVDPLSSISLRIVQSEVDSLMKVYASRTGDSSNYEFVYEINNELLDGSFSYSILKKNNVLFSGKDEIAISHAVYTFLEELGFLFDITGISTPDQFNILSSVIQDTVITPKIRWRGIRQHVNFPMDISSYSASDAKEYIDCLVRLRFNKIAIHSYPGQWYETKAEDGAIAYAGNFFYGNKHFQHDNEFIKRMVPENDTLFCIPEAEKIKNDEKATSSFAVQWMQELVRYSKERGLYIQFSFEPRTTSIERAVMIAKDIYKTYPTIDALELITDETGGWGPGSTSEEVKATLKKYFSEDIVNNQTVLKPIQAKQSDLNALYSQIGANSRAIQQLEVENTISGVELKLGIYCSVTKYTEGAYRLARLSLPNTKIALLSSHGSDGVAKAIPTILSSIEDLKQTEIYSWIEFDGLMFTLQNANNGNEQLANVINEIGNKSAYAPSILFNHWRTAENRTAARYASEMTINGTYETSDFYANYAKKIGISDAVAYDKAMRLINDADSYSTTSLGNIGFCWMGAWRKNRGLGPYIHNIKALDKTRETYVNAGNILASLIASTDVGSNVYNYLSFLGNRTVCSIFYLDAFEEMTSLREIKKDKQGKISEKDKEKFKVITNKALRIFDEYMYVHAKMMPDRGCKGTLVNIWNAPIRGLKEQRADFCGIPMDELPANSEPIDAPPLPIFYEELSH